MKTILQKTNLARSVKNTKSKNFFQKILLVMAVMAFTGFGFKSQAQSYRYSWDNQTDCDITLDFCTNSPPACVAVSQVVATNNSTSGGWSSCFPSITSGFVKFTDGNGCILTINFTGGTLTGVTSTCNGQTGGNCAASNTPDTYDVTSSSGCGGGVDLVITITP